MISLSYGVIAKAKLASFASIALETAAREKEAAV
jgi:hypothetical protein